MRSEHQRGLGVFKHLNGQFPTHRREVFKEDLKRIARLQVLKKDPHRNPGPDEDERSTKDFRI